MSSDKPLRERRESAADPVPAAGERAGERWAAAEADEDWAGGDPVCWAALVCQECGAMISEGHRDGCSQAADSAGP